MTTPIPPVGPAQPNPRKKASNKHADKEEPAKPAKKRAAAKARPPKIQPPPEPIGVTTDPGPVPVAPPLVSEPPAPTPAPASKKSWADRLLAFMPFKTWADARAFLYIMTPVIASGFVTAGFLSDDKVNLIVPLVLAVLNWPLQAHNSVATWRTYIYHILGAVNVIAIGIGWWTNDFWTPWVGLGGMIITNVLAHWFTPTSGTPTPAETTALLSARRKS